MNDDSFLDKMIKNIDVLLTHMATGGGRRRCCRRETGRATHFSSGLQWWHCRQRTI